MVVNWKKEWKKLAILTAGFLACFYLPVGIERFDNAITEALHLVKWYAREHVLLCLVPAFFIAGGVSVFINRETVIKYFGADANRFLSYTVASVSGTILAVCSCTVLPLFAGIYRTGAGIGPATAFLYSGPAINVLAIILTGRVLGIEMGIARAVGAILFSVVIGLSMQFIYRNEKVQTTDEQMPELSSGSGRKLWQEVIFFASMIGVLVFANFAAGQSDTGTWHEIHSHKWQITSGFAILLAVTLVLWFGIKWWKMAVCTGLTVLAVLLFKDNPLVPFCVGIMSLSVVIGTDSGQAGKWFKSSWSFAKQILPLLLFGVLTAGLLLGSPGGEGVVPSEWIAKAVGGNSIFANLFASIAGAFMYFATLTEVPILKGLMGAGMGKGPALALLLSGPALSLPNMLVIGSVLGAKKTAVFVALVIVMATLSGITYGAIF